LGGGGVGIDGSGIGAGYCGDASLLEDSALVLKLLFLVGPLDSFSCDFDPNPPIVVAEDGGVTALANLVASAKSSCAILGLLALALLPGLGAANPLWGSNGTGT
jgi:hypothetical protein